jgi:hypothetical protein
MYTKTYQCIPKLIPIVKPIQLQHLFNYQNLLQYRNSCQYQNLNERDERLN